MPNYNRWIGAGNLTRDPEVRETSAGAVVTFALAINPPPRGGATERPPPLFLDIEAWGKRGEAIAQYCKKGDPLLVEGHLRLDRWENDGQKRSRVLCVVDTFEFLGPRS